MDRPQNNNENGKTKIFRVVISALCAVFFCRRYFSEGVTESIDSGWVWALNRAIHDGRTFGTGFVFTYGPLGFLSTRYTEYVGAWPLLVGDMILTAGFFYFIFRKVTPSIPATILMLAAVILLRNAYYSQALFVLFFIYMSMVYTEKRMDTLSLIFTALYAVMLFFLKANYGLLVPGFVAVAIVLLVARRDWRSIMWLLLPLSVFSSCVLLMFSVYVPGYIRHGLSLISGYEEAMFLPVNFHSAEYNIMTAFLVIASTLAVVYVFHLHRRKILHAGYIVFVCFFGASVFLAYKNGITRFDGQHTRQFLALFPFLLTSTVILAAQYRRSLVVVVLAGVVVASFAGTVTKGSSPAAIAEEAWSLTSVHGYYSTVLKTSWQQYPSSLLLSDEKKKLFGRASVDVIPHELYFAAANNLNYSGRPVCQSYSVYKPELDDLNANFFLSAKGPEAVMVSGSVVDLGCYRGFYEPLTHAAICLNYDYEATTLPGDSLPANNNEYFTVFRKSRRSRVNPVFTQIADSVFGIDDTIAIPTGGNPVYMTVNVKYTAIGRLNKLLLQPMPVTITLYMEDGQYYDYRLQLPMVESPVPVSRLLSSTREVGYFLSGRQQQLRKMKAFKISTHNPEIDRDILVRFYVFGNYRGATDTSNILSAGPARPSAWPG